MTFKNLKTALKKSQYVFVWVAFADIGSGGFVQTTKADISRLAKVIPDNAEVIFKVTDGGLYVGGPK